MPYLRYTQNCARTGKTQTSSVGGQHITRAAAPSTRSKHLLPSLLSVPRAPGQQQHMLSSDLRTPNVNLYTFFPDDYCTNLPAASIDNLARRIHSPGPPCRYRLSTRTHVRNYNVCRLVFQDRRRVWGQPLAGSIATPFSSRTLTAEFLMATCHTRRRERERNTHTKKRQGWLKVADKIVASLSPVPWNFYPPKKNVKRSATLSYYFTPATRALPPPPPRL